MKAGDFNRKRSFLDWGSLPQPPPTPPPTLPPTPPQPPWDLALIRQDCRTARPRVAPGRADLSPLRNARSAQFVMNYRNSAPKAWLRDFHTPAAIISRQTETASVCCFSNCLTKSMRPSPQASFIRIAEIESWRTNG